MLLRLDDGRCYTFCFRETPEGKWEAEQSLKKQHEDWVRDVAWAPSSGLPTDIIASCSAGKKGGATDAKPETKERNNYARDPKNKDGLVSKWHQGGKKGGKKGGATDANPETKERLPNYALNPENKDGYDSKWQKGARLANAATQTNCITCKMVPRQGQSDKYNQCQLAVFFST
jgi:hypothetical protein